MGVGFCCIKAGMGRGLQSFREWQHTDLGLKEFWVQQGKLWVSQGK